MLLRATPGAPARWLGRQAACELAQDRLSDVSCGGGVAQNESKDKARMPARRQPDHWAAMRLGELTRGCPSVARPREPGHCAPSRPERGVPARLHR